MSGPDLCVCGCGFPTAGAPRLYIHGHNRRRPPREAARYPCECGCGALTAMNYIRGHNNRRPASERFWSFVQKTDECWLWIGGKNNAGYGRLSVEGRAILAHRFSWELARGPIPPDRELDHLCRTPACVSPDHLEPVPHSENMRRGFWGMKRLCPEGHPYSHREERGKRGRRCRVCRRRAAHQRYAANRQAVLARQQAARGWKALA